LPLSLRDYFADHARFYASGRPAYPEELFRFVACIATAHERAWGNTDELRRRRTDLYTLAGRVPG
jgi:hypothetical protein